MSPYNTRLFKQQQQQEAGGSSGSSTKYSVLVASASSDPANVTERSFTFEGCEFELRFGDHAAHMDAIASALSNAIGPFVRYFRCLMFLTYILIVLHFWCRVCG